MSAKEVTLEVAKEKKTRKPRVKKETETKNVSFSLRGVRDLKKQRELLEEEIKRLKEETEKLGEKLNEVNNKLDDNDWKELTKRFSKDEIMKRLKQQEN